MPDVPRAPVIRLRRRLRRGGYAAVGVLIVAAVSIVVARIELAAPVVERSTVLLDTVRRGPLVREVRGSGTLVPEEMPAATEGRVERILLRPGAPVAATTMILELSNPQVENPQVEQDAITARLAFEAAAAGLENLRLQLASEMLAQEGQLAALDAELAQAQINAQADAVLAKQQLVSELTRRQSQLRADALDARRTLEAQRLAAVRQAHEARPRVQRAAVDQARAAAALQDARRAALRVTAGFAGVLQQVPVEIGQRVAQGQNLARVADPTRLKAELRIAETQADIEVGQIAQVDLRNGLVAGRVARKDPAAIDGTVTVDVAFTADLPRGAVPDSTVDGTIQLERLEDVLHVGRPSIGPAGGPVGLFRLRQDDQSAVRVEVQLGRSSATAIEVRSGLQEGDVVVLSDMSMWDAFDRIRLR